MGDMRKDYVLEREVIVHPTTKKYVEFKSELPEDMLKLLEFVVKY